MKTQTKEPLKIDFYYAGDGYVVKLYRGWSTSKPCLETGIGLGPETPETMKKALRDLHSRWTKR